MSLEAGSDIVVECDSGPSEASMSRDRRKAKKKRRKKDRKRQQWKAERDQVLSFRKRAPYRRVGVASLLLVFLDVRSTRFGELPGSDLRS